LKVKEVIGQSNTNLALLLFDIEDEELGGVLLVTYGESETSSGRVPASRAAWTAADDDAPLDVTAVCPPPPADDAITVGGYTVVRETYVADDAVGECCCCCWAPSPTGRRSWP
jgi:hypothetical protein